MRLSKNFTLSEFAVSSSYPELAAAISFSGEDRLKALYLAQVILQPVRDNFGSVTILSGKRSPELNQKVGGSPTSDHLYTPGSGSAAVDFTCANVEDAYMFLKLGLEPYQYGQLILYIDSGFVHVSAPTVKHEGDNWSWNR